MYSQIHLIKLNFFSLIDALLEKFGNGEDINKLPGQIGRWLSGACDREGGRKQRHNNN